MSSLRIIHLIFVKKRLKIWLCEIFLISLQRKKKWTVSVAVSTRDFHSLDGVSTTPPSANKQFENDYNIRTAKIKMKKRRFYRLAEKSFPNEKDREMLKLLAEGIRIGGEEEPTKEEMGF